MKAAKTPKKLKEVLFLFRHKKIAFEKKRKKYYTSKDKCRNFTNFFRTPKIKDSKLSNEEQRT